MTITWLHKRAAMIIGLMILMGVTLYYTLAGWGVPARYTVFAKCVAGSGTHVYTKLWDEPSNRQRDMFGKAARHLPEINCSSRSGLFTASVCERERITTFPTWIFTYGDRVEGVLTPEQIASRTRCSLPE